MRFRVVLAVIAAVVSVVVPAHSQAVRISLTPLFSSGLNNPDYITNAHDGSNRLFIIEQPGTISVVQPGRQTRTTFLDISRRVLFGGEQGLLGLAFHPQFTTNGKLYVDYTRQPDGATVIAQYRVSVSNPNVADATENVLMIIPQPYANHNGGMLEFGPDGYLYIGMGDGGSANDPQNRAQNTFELLGKILRIDVDRSTPPPTNPYADGRSGRPEIYAIGLRNPFRFSFDAATHQLYVGDVGQDQREEVDIVTPGGNYGWRVIEGTRCTNLGPASCAAPGFISPIAEYDHSTNGRCSIIGGYVYRGSQQSLPYGAYIYGDYCSGEIFMLRAGVQSVLTRTSLNLTSFGEDEAGELFVISQGGSIFRITNPDATSAAARFFSMPEEGSTSFSSAGALIPTIGYARIQAPAGGTLAAGVEIIGVRNNGFLAAETAVPASPLLSTARIYTEVNFQPPNSNINTAVAIANPNTQAVSVDFYFTDESGNDFGGGSMSIPAGHQIAAFITEPPFSVGRAVFQGSFTFKSTALVSAVAIRGMFQDAFVPVVLPVVDLAAPPAGVQTIPHFVVNAGWATDIEMVNPSDSTIAGVVRALNPAGQSVTADIAYSIPPHGSARYPILISNSSDIQAGSLRITPSQGNDAPSAAALVRYKNVMTTVAASPSGSAYRMFVETLGNLGVAGSIAPAIAIANTTSSAATVTLALYASDGTLTGVSGSLSIPPNGQIAAFLRELAGFSSLPSSFQGVLRVASSSAVTVSPFRMRYNKRGDFLMTSVAAVPEDVVPATSEVLFPHFVTGGDYEMEFVLFSGRAGAAPGTIYFFDQNGNGLNLPVR